MFVDLGVGNLVEAVGGRRWDCRQIGREVATRIARFQARGVHRGDRVFLHFGNRLEFFAELLALWRLGACAVPVDARLTPFEVRTLVSAATPRLAVVDDASVLLGESGRLHSEKSGLAEREGFEPSKGFPLHP